MVAKFIFLALSCLFILQIHHVRGPDPNEGTSQVIQGQQQQQQQDDFTHPVAKRAINTVLRHFRIIMTNPVSAFMVRYIASTVNAVFTSEIGQKNVKALVDFVVKVLKSPNTLLVVTTFHRRLLQLAKSSPSAPMVLESASLAVKKVLSEPKLFDATEGFIDGFNILLQGMDDKKLREGIHRLKKMQSLAGYMKPLLGKKVPQLKKMRTSPTTGELEADPGFDVDAELQTRDMEWLNGKPQFPFASTAEDTTVSIGGDI